MPVTLDFTMEWMDYVLDQWRVMDIQDTGSWQAAVREWWQPRSRPSNFSSVFFTSRITFWRMKWATVAAVGNRIFLTSALGLQIYSSGVANVGRRRIRGSPWLSVLSHSESERCTFQFKSDSNLGSKLFDAWAATRRAVSLYYLFRKILAPPLRVFDFRWTSPLC